MSFLFVLFTISSALAATYEGFWGDADPASASGPSQTEDNSSDSDTSDGDARPMLAPRCEDPEPILWPPPTR